MVIASDEVLEQLADLLARDFPLLQRKIVLRVVHAAQGEFPAALPELEVVVRGRLAALSVATHVRSV